MGVLEQQCHSINYFLPQNVSSLYIYTSSKFTSDIPGIMDISMAPVGRQQTPHRDRLALPLTSACSRGQGDVQLVIEGCISVHKEYLETYGLHPGLNVQTITIAT